MTDLDDLRAELDAFAQPEKKKSLSAKEERIIAGFEEIQHFVEEHGKVPQHGEDKDIFERLYAVRLERLCAQEECRTLLTPLDHQGLLGTYSEQADSAIESMDDDALLAELDGLAASSEITELKHVRSTEQKRVVEEMASRDVCTHFEEFKPLFDKVQQELDAGLRDTKPLQQQPEIFIGDWFILYGQKAYVAEIEDITRNVSGHKDGRLRVIFDNGTESNLLIRSLQKALMKDETARIIMKISQGPLFADTNEDDGLASGTIYVLRSQSQHPFVAEHRALIHKIGVTGGKVETRIANAAQDSTYLLAEVEIVATYQLSGINRTKLEKLLHKIFSAAQIDLTIEDRFGRPVKPREWFLVPISVIDKAVDAIRDGSITQLVYDPKVAQLVSHIHQ
ncbi:hypothetical protein LCGC14_1137050 [marine sediment metagenome]|uniref:Bacteriophage T5 Orf172 DNA-binding domain-containing protein n=1 Tax=marine sediment metagenome TaxID=412755 RepID=A0A0F9Q541_9ZZZZ|nr:GIY-YIG nuclease family protein [Methylophaga sp.]